MSASARAFRSVRCEALDPLQVFAAAGTAPRFYWEQPAAERFCVGIGCAARISVHGVDRFEQAEAAAREVFGSMTWQGAGPRLGHLVGGFAFAPGIGSGNVWQGFPDGELRLPELVYWRDGERYVRDACIGSRWADLQPRPLALGQPVRGPAEIGNGGPDPYVERVQRALAGIRAGELDKVVIARAVHVTSRSPIWIRPAVGFSRPAMSRRVVVLPQPEGPRSAKNSPSRIARLDLLTATTWPNCLTTS